MKKTLFIVLATCCCLALHAQNELIVYPDGVNGVLIKGEISAFKNGRGTEFRIENPNNLGPVTPGENSNGIGTEKKDENDPQNGPVVGCGIQTPGTTLLCGPGTVQTSGTMVIVRCENYNSTKCASKPNPGRSL